MWKKEILCHNLISVDRQKREKGLMIYYTTVYAGAAFKENSTHIFNTLIYKIFKGFHIG